MADVSVSGGAASVGAGSVGAGSVAPGSVAPGSVDPGSATWLDAFTSEGFEVRREREWEPAERHRGGLPDALEVPVAADEIAFAVVVDADTDTVFVLPPDPGTDREALGRLPLALAPDLEPLGRERVEPSR